MRYPGGDSGTAGSRATKWLSVGRVEGELGGLRVLQEVGMRGCWKLEAGCGMRGSDSDSDSDGRCKLLLDL